MGSISIAGRPVGNATRPYVIAEIGHNHGGSLEAAKELVRAAAEAGADGVKLQKRTNRAIFTEAMYNAEYTGRNSFGPTYGAHREYLELDQSDYQELQKVAFECNVDLFATAFDPQSVDFLEKLDAPAIKIASGDLTYTQLLRTAAATGIPMIVSTGGADAAEVRRAYEAIRGESATVPLALLQCTATYPARPEELNLGVISTYAREFDDPHTVTGYSGHDSGIDGALLAVGLGARVVEKHFTLDRTAPGSDHHFSLLPEELGELTSRLDLWARMLGDPRKQRLPQEAAALRKMRKCLVAARDLEPDAVLTEKDIAFKSPGDGPMLPYEADELIGRTMRVAVRRDEFFDRGMLAPAGTPSRGGTGRREPAATAGSRP
ncbi:hypothetical protein BIV57_09585 [Mangrovactinospora gilvigrisea]|uniref:SAF domain-containing protein n=1 Tax=Mangrovactinospora gilvigrisea TaxID=1428644 RepID=A0A1J7C8E8_9ACTN|nr:N-acetylneuraminate synthase family protein [Mangrovactinospora gilvigrisea]OIV37804.1 hypothetical protein BIV57_09585 [Mangrovactinospora gilvigrisea]